MSLKEPGIIPFPKTSRKKTIDKSGGQKGGSGSICFHTHKSRLNNVAIKQKHPIDVRLKELGLTRHDLAKRVHRTVQTINLYCNRRLMIDPDSYLGREFCRVLQTDFSFLIMGVRNNRGS